MKYNRGAEHERKMIAKFFAKAKAGEIELAKSMMNVKEERISEKINHPISTSTENNIPKDFSR